MGIEYFLYPFAFYDNFLYIIGTALVYITNNNFNKIF